MNMNIMKAALLYIVGVFALLILVGISEKVNSTPMWNENSPFESNCRFRPLLVGETTIKEAQCILKRKGFKHVSSISIRTTNIETYRYRSSRFSYTTVVFINGILRDTIMNGTS
jgi:hypothetical protein